MLQMTVKIVERQKLSLPLTKHYAMKMYLLLKHHPMKTYWGSGGIAPCILNLSTR